MITSLTSTPVPVLFLAPLTAQEAGGEHPTGGGGLHRSEEGVGQSRSPSQVTGATEDQTCRQRHVQVILAG